MDTAQQAAWASAFTAFTTFRTTTLPAALDQAGALVGNYTIMEMSNDSLKIIVTSSGAIFLVNLIDQSGNIRCRKSTGEVTTVRNSTNGALLIAGECRKAV